MLQARVVHENPAVAFLTYDDEHHRIALTDPDGMAELTAEHGGESLGEFAGEFVGSGTAALPADLSTLPPHGLMHIAFTYGSLLDLLETYERLAEGGVKPVTVINHGTTTSLYYADPDGNNIELQIDNFDTAEEHTAFIESESFRRNPAGVPFDPDELLTRLRAGESVAALVTPTW
ncbi:VOC family protein [Streptomyces sp. NPDC005574]|uniref:VOC family protein n=1 Tax=Streptomyces sp. NPDC005574 TaxID=3156891 RepID=UPI0033B96CB3